MSTATTPVRSNSTSSPPPPSSSTSASSSSTASTIQSSSGSSSSTTTTPTGLMPIPPLVPPPNLTTPGAPIPLAPTAYLTYVVPPFAPPYPLPGAAVFGYFPTPFRPPLAGQPPQLPPQSPPPSQAPTSSQIQSQASLLRAKQSPLATPPLTGMRPPSQLTPPLTPSQPPRSQPPLNSPPLPQSQPAVAAGTLQSSTPKLQSQVQSASNSQNRPARSSQEALNPLRPFSHALQKQIVPLQTSSTSNSNSNSNLNSNSHSNSSKDREDGKVAIVPPKMIQEAFLGMNNSLSLYEDFVQVGEGTYGVVYKARNRETNELVALKCIKMENEKEGFPITAMREIKVLQKLHHKNVVALKEIITSKDLVYLVIEYMEHDLTGLLGRPDIDFSEQVIKCYMKQLLEGIAYLHSKSIVHRDVKASNLLVNNKGELKLADFGLARTFSIKHEEKVYTNRIITLRYRPPELLLGATNYGPEIDMWSVGCIMAELFTKKPLFRGEDEIAQISLIFKKCGSPTPENWPDAEKLVWYKFLKPKHALPRVLIAELKENELSDGALDLIDKMLTLDPSKRISAADALKHDYFTKEYPPACPMNEMPSFESECREFETKKLKRQRNGDGADYNKKFRYDLS